MDKRPQIAISVQEDGAVTTDFSRFVGPDCLEAGKQLHQLLQELGIQIEVTQMTPKPELYAPQPDASQEIHQMEQSREGGQTW